MFSNAVSINTEYLLLRTASSLCFKDHNNSYDLLVGICHPDNTVSGNIGLSGQFTLQKQ